MLHMQASCLALAVVAPGAVAACPLDRAQLFSPLSQPLAGASHG